VEDEVAPFLFFKFIIPIDFKFNGLDTFVETKNMPGEQLIIKAIDDEKMTIMI